MKVLQHTRNKRNLFFKPDRLDRFYRDSLLIICQRDKNPVSLRITFQRTHANLLSSNVTQHGEFIKATFSSKKFIETKNIFSFRGKKSLLFHSVREDKKPNRIKLPYATRSPSVGASMSHFVCMK